MKHMIFSPLWGHFSLVFVIDFFVPWDLLNHFYMNKTILGTFLSVDFEPETLYLKSKVINQMFLSTGRSLSGGKYRTEFEFGRGKI